MNATNILIVLVKIVWITDAKTSYLDHKEPATWKYLICLILTYMYISYFNILRHVYGDYREMKVRIIQWIQPIPVSKTTTTKRNKIFEFTIRTHFPQAERSITIITITNECSYQLNSTYWKHLWLNSPMMGHIYSMGLRSLQE